MWLDGSSLRNHEEEALVEALGGDRPHISVGAPVGRDRPYASPHLEISCRTILGPGHPLDERLIDVVAELRRVVIGVGRCDASAMCSIWAVP